MTTTEQQQTSYQGKWFDGAARRGYEVLDEYYSVFNGHVNDADKRARTLMSVIAPRQLAAVEQIERDGGGIMAIFQQSPTHATTMYAALVTAFVNEHARIERGEPRPEVQAREI